MLPDLDRIALFFLAALAIVFLWVWQPRAEDCKWPQCDLPEKPNRTVELLDDERRKVGDIYDPGTGRLQIRNNVRQITGYIEADGTITDRLRRRVGQIDE